MKVKHKNVKTRLVSHRHRHVIFMVTPPRLIVLTLVGQEVL